MKEINNYFWFLYKNIKEFDMEEKREYRYECLSLMELRYVTEGVVELGDSLGYKDFGYRDRTHISPEMYAVFEYRDGVSRMLCYVDREVRDSGVLERVEFGLQQGAGFIVLCGDLQIKEGCVMYIKDMVVLMGRIHIERDVRIENHVYIESAWIVLRNDVSDHVCLVGEGEINHPIRKYVRMCESFPNFGIDGPYTKGCVHNRLSSDGDNLYMCIEDVREPKCTFYRTSSGSVKCYNSGTEMITDIHSLEHPSVIRCVRDYLESVLGVPEKSLEMREYARDLIKVSMTEKGVPLRFKGITGGALGDVITKDLVVLDYKGVPYDGIEMLFYKGDTMMRYTLTGKYIGKIDRKMIGYVSPPNNFYDLGNLLTSNGKKQMEANIKTIDMTLGELMDRMGVLYFKYHLKQNDKEGYTLSDASFVSKLLSEKDPLELTLFSFDNDENPGTLYSLLDRVYLSRISSIIRMGSEDSEKVRDLRVRCVIYPLPDINDCINDIDCCYQYMRHIGAMNSKTTKI